MFDSFSVCAVGGSSPPFFIFFALGVLASCPASSISLTTLRHISLSFSFASCLLPHASCTLSSRPRNKVLTTHPSTLPPWNTNSGRGIPRAWYFSCSSMVFLDDLAEMMRGSGAG